jgi:SAM-dependent methyltransferase
MASGDSSVDALERLSLDEVGSGSLIASEHLHRYELAAELCRGLRVADVCCGIGYGSALMRDAGADDVTGVDNEAAVIEEARSKLTPRPGLEFELADAVDFLERDLSGKFDAIVMFEGLEHIPDPERALRALRRHADSGMRVIVSIPNSRAFEEDNPHHLTDYGYEDGVAALRRLGEEVSLLYQFAAEGSLIRPEAAGKLDGSFVLPEYGEPALCNHMIGLVNFDSDRLEAAGAARMQLEVAPLHRGYMLLLEAKVDELWGLYTEKRDEVAALRNSRSWKVTKPLRAREALRRRRSGS